MPGAKFLVSGVISANIRRKMKIRRHKRRSLLLAGLQVLSALLMVLSIPSLSIMASASLLAPQAAHAAPGDLDNSFGLGGKVTTAIGAQYDYSYSVVLQSDGKIVAVGSTFDGSSNDFALARYNTNGALDTSFGAGGKVITDMGDDVARAAAIQSDGKIVVAGGVSNGDDADLALVRYNTNGSLDTSFGANGKAITDLGSNRDSANAVAIQGDGKIVVIGQSADNVLIARYGSYGTVDGDFGTNGKASGISGASRHGYSIAVQKDGKIVIAGESNNNFLLARYNTNGALDTNCGLPDSISRRRTGFVTTDFGGKTDIARSIALQEDGKIILAGESGNDFALARYNFNGDLDTSFGSTGKVTSHIGSANNRAYSVASRVDGKIVAAGESNNDFAVALYDSNGVLDASFGNGGKRVTDFNSATDIGRSVAVQSDGNIVVAGMAVSGASVKFALARYLANAGEDTGVPPPPGGLVRAQQSQSSGLGATLAWTNPPAVTQYHIQVVPYKNDGPGINLIIGDIDLVRLAKFELKPPVSGVGNYLMLPGMTYTWQIRTTNSNKPLGDASTGWSAWASSTFRTPDPTSVTISVVSPGPDGVVNTLTPALRWRNANQNIFYYEVQVSKDPGFGTSAFLYGELVHGGVANPPDSYRVPEAYPLEAGIAYYWRVRPRVQGDGTPVGWSTVWTFRTSTGAP